MAQDSLLEFKLFLDNAVEFSRQMLAQNEDLRARLAASEAEVERLTRAVAFEKANTQESSDNGARWRWQYEQEVARRDEAIHKREEAERANLKMVNVLTRFSEQGPYTDDSGDCGFCQTPSYEGEAEVNPQAHEVGCLWRDADALLPAPEKKSQEKADE